MFDWDWNWTLQEGRSPGTGLSTPDLEYLQEAKILNPHQTRWALFFTCFNFTISFHPGAKNVQANTLSYLYTLEEATEEPEPILPSTLFVNPIQWSQDQPTSSNVSEATSPGSPLGLQYVPCSQRTPLIHSMHSSLSTGHPEANSTLLLLKDCFWLPDLLVMWEGSCNGRSDCATSWSPHHIPDDKLNPLSILNHPWSHLWVDYSTELPHSDGNTCILVVIDRFSKSCCLLPLKGIPTMMEIAELLFNHVFRYFGIPEEIVSYRGPQFISKVWKAFFTILGVTVSLSSG